jgi:bifunctional non-homologous end joining protein LigD
LLDGEIVCLDSEGRSIFDDLPHRRGFPVFYTFDSIYLDDRDLRQLPLMERKLKLQEILVKANCLM